MPKATSDGEALVNPRFALPLWHRVVGFYERFAPGRSLALLVSDYRNGNGWLPKATSDGEALVNPRFALPDRQLCIHRFYPGRLHTRQPFNQRRVLLRRADADTQELGYSQLFEVPHDHALRTQFCGQRSRIVLRVAGKDEVGR